MTPLKKIGETFQKQVLLCPISHSKKVLAYNFPIIGMEKKEICRLYVIPRLLKQPRTNGISKSVLEPVIISFECP